MQSEGKLFTVFEGKSSIPPPLWLMRQAGRYLPEYREIKVRAGSFWKICMTPGLAAEVSLQPVRRFGFDAAIVFSDILVLAAALGQSVRFDDSTGAETTRISSVESLEDDLEKRSRVLEPVYEALRLTRAGLEASVALLGFAGAPWTLATYLAAGGGGDGYKAAKLWSYRDPVEFGRLMDVLADCVSQHLIGQLQAGANAVQIFDSWASGLPEQMFAQWVVAPTRKIITKVRATVPQARIIGFPRGATLKGYELYASETGVDAISLDAAVPMDWAAHTLGPRVVCQGNLDPVALLAGGRALAEGVDNILEAMRGVPFIFNLGHGVLPETPVKHVEELVRLVRSAR